MQISPESVADLVDLEQELTSLQRGISQMERITPNDPSNASHQPGGHMGQLAKSASEDDPFGDSFIYVPSYNILPPPPDSGRTRHKQLSKTPESGTGGGAAASGSALDAMSTLLSPAPGASSPATLQGAACAGGHDDDDSWLHELHQQNDVFDTTKVTATPTPMSAAAMLSRVPMASMAPLATRESSATPTQQISDISAATSAAAVAATQDAGGVPSGGGIDVGLSALAALGAGEEGATTTVTGAAQSAAAALVMSGKLQSSLRNTHAHRHSLTHTHRNTELAFTMDAKGHVAVGRGGGRKGLTDELNEAQSIARILSLHSRGVRTKSYRTL